MQTFESIKSANDEYDTLTMTSIIASDRIPASHKRFAQNYMVIKRIFGFSAVASPISNYEKAILKHRNFKTLENSTIRDINLELESIKKWSNSQDAVLKEYSDKLIEIRVKELKFIHSCNQHISELNNGYQALERYLEKISD